MYFVHAFSVNICEVKKVSLTNTILIFLILFCLVAYLQLFLPYFGQDFNILDLRLLIG